MFIIYRCVLLITDVLLIHVAFVSALLLGFDFSIPISYFETYLSTALVLTLIHVLVNNCFHLYHSLLRYITTREILYISGATLFGCSLFFIYTHTYGIVFPSSVYIIYATTLLLLMILSRFSYKFANRFLCKFSTGYNILKCRLNGVERERILLIGAGDAASIVIREHKKNPQSHVQYVAILDDAPHKLHGKLHGVPIRGPISDLSKYVARYTPDTILVCMPSAGRTRIAEILSLCNTFNCKLKLFSGVATAVSDSTSPFQTRHVNIEDLLGRDEISLDTTQVTRDIASHTILVTGGGGSIGSELCRQISLLSPKRLIIFDIYENNAYDIQNELRLAGFPDSCLETIIGSVRDVHKLEYVFSTYKPSFVFHAAAHKHVPLMEDSPYEAVKNNIFGTLNVALAARKHQTRKFILISTDKAVNPTNIMGATKRMCEMIIQSINETTATTDYVAVRFGNVLGSNGSVIPLFKRQLEAGGPLTVTHPDIIRYFMTIPEAVRLILQAMSFASGGEIFVLDMGSPVKILDLAENFIRLSGYEPYRDIDITFSGLRPGEKLYEELLMKEEGLIKTDSQKIFIGKPCNMPFSQVMEHIKTLRMAIDAQLDIKQTLASIVPTYHMPPPRTNKKASAKDLVS